MGKIIEINGPLVIGHLPGIPNGEQVRVGELGLTGEIIGLDGDTAMIQVYEATDGLRPGQEIEPLGHPLSVELGPGLLGQIFDGVQRPLSAISELSGDYIARGIDVDALPRDRSWAFERHPERATGQRLKGGAVLGTVSETKTIRHRILLPPDLEGELTELASAGSYKLDDVIGKLRGPIPPRPADVSISPAEASLSEAEFCKRVEACKEYIAAGDIYQIVLSVLFRGRTNVQPFEVYRAMRLLNPSPYMYFLELDGLTVAGSSPEALVKLEGRRASLRPIAGTRPRGATPAEDQELEAELLASMGIPDPYEERV